MITQSMDTIAPSRDDTFRRSKTPASPPFSSRFVGFVSHGRVQGNWVWFFHEIFDLFFQDTGVTPVSRLMGSLVNLLLRNVVRGIMFL